ncbi:hypothetical protein HUJ04_011141 [Dendroctonus ponderosae]|nr:hypothetical protein HUJ04_011141 [Dendroctonus ponderosae]
MKTPTIIKINSLGGKSLTVAGRIQKKDIQITIDTGADVKIVRPDKLAEATIEPLRDQLALRSVTGEACPVNGEADVTIGIGGGLEVQHKDWVAKIKDEFILGMDLIRKYGFSYDHKRNILKFGDEEFTLISKDAGSRSSACYKEKHAVTDIRATTDNAADKKINYLIGVGYRSHH